MLVANKHCAIFTNLYKKGDTWEGPEGVRLIPRGGGGYLAKCLLGMCRWPLRSPTPLQSILWPIIDPILATFGQIITLSFYELNHFLNWMKSTLLFTHSGNILGRLLTVNIKNCLTPKNPKMWHPILVTLLKFRPLYSQSSCANATLSSGTFL